MNELFFLAHCAAILLFILGALRLGKEALIALFVVQAFLANLFVIKQISLFGFIVTPTDVFAVGGLLSLNLIREYFGKTASKQALWAAFFSLFFFAVMGRAHLFYVPHISDQTQSAFALILKHSPRILLSSIFVFLITQKLDLLLFNFLRKKWQTRRLALRLSISLFLSQLIDTILFSFIALFGIVESVWDIIFISFAIKVVTILLMVPFTAFTKRMKLNAI